MRAAFKRSALCFWAIAVPKLVAPNLRPCILIKENSLKNPYLFPSPTSAIIITQNVTSRTKRDGLIDIFTSVAVIASCEAGDKQYTVYCHKSIFVCQCAT
jgi:hypothetical protein